MSIDTVTVEEPDVPRSNSNGTTTNSANVNGSSDPGHVHAQAIQDDKPILIIVMGVAGTGKTTLAKALNTELAMPYVEGDDLHPKANIVKMSEGIPLNDRDREPWLERIRTEAEKVVAAEQSQQPEREQEREREPKQSKKKGVMVTCSSLKRYYRDILRGTHRADKTAPALPTYFVYIKEDVPLLRERIGNRKGHFMKSGMLDSQLETLESPEGEEGVVVVPLNASTEEQVTVALGELERLVGPLQ